jgi:hypothetical protein
MDNDLFNIIFMMLVGVLIVVVIVFALNSFNMITFKKDTTFTLYSSEWTCTVYKTRTTLMPVFNGKTTMLMPMTQNMCIKYEKVK